MAAKRQPPRERAARALCRLAGNPENATGQGRPLWQSYLPEVDAVLEAALAPEEFERLLKPSSDESR